ncbi:hypothetical protein AB0J52_41505 [Spirillospora sp. NPDC049652]
MGEKTCDEPHCKGQGGWWVAKNGKPERWVSCPRCGGSGKVPK